VLAGYVGFQAVQRERAIEFGRRYAESHHSAEVSAIPRPVSPFNWTVIVTEGDRYHLANVNLMRDEMPATAGTGLIAQLNSRYAPLNQAQWTIVHKYGSQASDAQLAVRVLAHPKLAFYRWFAEYPALYRIDRANPQTCVWFEDLRFAIPGRDSFGFRYGLCGEDDNWRAFRLLDQDTSEPVD
jgi:inner membrane protein